VARLYADENFPLPTVSELRRLGHDVLTTSEAERAEQSIGDEAVLKFASAEGRAVMTLNRWHFIRLHGLRPDHSGIIVCTFDRDFVALARRVHEAVTRVGTLHGELVRVNRPAS